MAVAFGKYELVRKLGTGGMGEVFLAKPAPGVFPPHGCDQLVIKRILPHLTENARFLRLFLDEARMAARLAHPNIARILELDEVGGCWFVGMEYVAGKDLREVCRQAKEAKLPIPVGVACRIARQLAQGLDYAHRSTDPTGRPLKLVHRDVSPHNVLLGFDGSVKLIDFGVAKAANKTSVTATGVLKGKFPYMSPEQAEGKRIDRRADVFAMGIVLWEMLAGRSLFRGKSDAATLKLVKACEVSPPSAHNSRVPTELDALVLRALEKAPKDRFQEAGALAAALEELLSVRTAVASRSDVGAYVRRLFPAGADESEDDELGEGTSEEILTSTDAENPSEETVNLRDGSSEGERASRVRARRHPASQGERHAALERTARLLAEVSQRPTNLVPQQTSFVGRVAELAELHQLHRQGARLLTLLGPGGTGKTRLAHQFATQQLPSFAAGGVWFCDLTEAQDLDGICLGVARALSVQLPAGKSAEELAAHLGRAIASRGSALLVLDNLEQVAQNAAAAVEQWMRAAPKARFLATSREVLRIPHEVVFEVPPLKVPEGGEDVHSSEAVLLFLERARAVRPGYLLDRADEAAVAEIVRQLDGMPLAIELAAARMAVLSPSQLVQRLPRRFDLLAGKRGATERQATLRGAIEWSWKMLRGYEQAALAQCSLFRGGFTADAAEAVVNLSSYPGAQEVLSCVMTLRAKSLVRSYVSPGSEGELRYGLYESIREFALEKLQKGREEAAACERHARYYIEQGRRCSEGAESSGALLDGLAVERENLYAVFQRGVSAPPGEAERRFQALEAVLVLDPLLALRGPFSSHLPMLDAAIDKAKDAQPLRLALALEARGKARQARWRLAEAAADFGEALRRARMGADLELEGRARFGLGSVSRLMGRIEDARGHFEQALALQRNVGDRRMEGRTLANLGQMLQERGKVTLALSRYVEALEIHREVGDRRFEGIILSNLGVLQQQQGLHGQAKENYESALAIHRELGNRRSEGIALLNLGDLHRDLEQPAQAMLFYERALTIHREVGNRRWEGIALAGMASLEQESGRLREASVRYRQALTLLREAGDRRHEALVLGAHAAVDALLGRLDEAEAELADAEAVLRELGDTSLLDALEVFRAHLEFVRSVQVSRAGGEQQAEALERSVAERVRRAEAASGADPDHPGGGPSPAERSEHVRAALRSLRAAMRRGVA
ncbi:MAG: tetratricopeptide repeat protein [Myxococcales bacterium]|nr:tetratricopeptide repeat protein [Myxococcales bacterium]